jgi:pyrrolysine biosynthesis protein PylC
VVIVGAGLQGIEAVYLARKTGWESILVDKTAEPPASGLCHRFIQSDVTDTRGFEALIENAGTVDLVVPALENSEALAALRQWSLTSTVPLAFDAAAYRVSSSKLHSDALFSRLGVPAPKPWPGCGFPVIAKPDRSSGSRGVERFESAGQLEARFGGALPPQGWVLQEYVEGPSYSLEVVGVPGDYEALQVTDLEMDDTYDCKRVTTPATLAPGRVEQFKDIGIKIAEALELRGLMDVEVILHGNELKVLEIDARLPSQTPTAVFHSLGCNLLESLAACFTDFKPRRPRRKKKAVIYEHIEVNGETIAVLGEHIMSEAGPLSWYEDFFGADEAITNYHAESHKWVATLIIHGPTRQAVSDKQHRVHTTIKQKFCGGHDKKEGGFTKEPPGAGGGNDKIKSGRS